MKLATMLSSVFAVGMVSLSPLALAVQPLTLHNNTDFPSTTVANNGPCSNILADGVTPAHTSPEGHQVSVKSIKAACILNPRNCNARVYLSGNCSGPVIANVTFDIDSGIKGDPITEAGVGYCLKKNGPFEITMAPKADPICN
jgi:hypothetical protein